MEILVKNASKRYGSTVVLDKVNLRLESGCVYGFQGINGSGKTMLMRLIAGLIYPTEGEVLVNGRALSGQNSFPDSMGLLIENPAFLGRYTGYENLLLLANIRHKITEDEIGDAMLRCGLDPDDKRKYKKYSLGMKQKLGIACAIMEYPELLILDEPFISLDEDGVKGVLKIIEEEKKRNALIILACHDRETMSNAADEIFQIVAGKITKHLKKDISGEFLEVQG